MTSYDNEYKINISTGIDIFNNWIKSFNHIYKFTKDSKYDNILPVMFPTISSKKQVLVLKSFKEKELINDSTIPVLNKMIKKTRKEEYRVRKEERELEKQQELKEQQEQQELIKDVVKISKKILKKLDSKDIRMFKAETFFAIENKNIEEFFRIALPYMRKFNINAPKLKDKEEIEFIDSYEDFKRVGWWM